MNPANILQLRAFKVLLVEDNASDAWLIQDMLNDACPGSFEITHVITIETAVIVLNEEAFDVVLLDLSLPGLSGVAALQYLQDTVPATPIVVLTGLDDEALALQIVQQGAQDYIIKGQGNGHLMQRALRYAIERKNFEENLIQLANYDTLTGLVNRSLFESRLGMALARAKRSKEPVVILFLDLDGFKSVNDLYGHDAGDTILKEAAARLKSCFRECDTVARFGGDEFVILLEGVRDEEDCKTAARKVMTQFEPPIFLQGKEMPVHISIGIAVATSPDFLPLSMLIKHADSAMYKAKETVGNSYCFFDEGLFHQDHKKSA